MSVTPSDLDNQERGLELSKRAGRKLSGLGAEDELRALRQRIAAALVTTPVDSQPHCGDCYRRGWSAALRSLVE